MNSMHRLLDIPTDLEAELAGFRSCTPHKELRGPGRSLVTFTPEMFSMIDEIEVAARHNVTVLLVGETGSGKTFLARLIHELSDRREHRFCNVACGALAPDLIESELFGCVRGAFTGADRDREGKFAAAGGGTLLLDEIDVLPLAQQARLLRVIETGEFEPVGSNETHHSQARLIAASNHDLEELVAAGRFRTDLYYRLNILTFRLLPLRERPWDLEYLARSLSLLHSRMLGIRLRTIEPAFLEALRTYHWPGNIRELENVLRRAVLYSRRGVLSVSDLPRSILTGGDAPPQHVTPNCDLSQPASVRTTAGASPHERPLRPAAAGRLPLVPIRRASAWPAAAAMPGAGSATLEARVEGIEQRIIEDCLRKNNFRRKETAAELGISRVTLYNKMKKFGLM